MCPLVLSPGTVVETWNGGQRQPLISRLLQHQWIQQKQQLQEKKYCSVGFFLGDKKWKDGNSGKGGDRKPQNLSSLCPSKRKPWSSGTWRFLNMCVHGWGGSKVTRTAQRHEENSDRKLKESKEKKNLIILKLNKAVESIFTPSHLPGPTQVMQYSS